ncbi:flavin reductase family protein [Tistrella mobilis]|jgi:flavin reductase (DIM6/NTAB) family NADH-FMN oxidoreductase RutF|uniref:flavin reductase family protein n=1 Tax=Tistrella mobilis TaxID=171437 RepID=UPI0031F7071F
MTDTLRWALQGSPADGDSRAYRSALGRFATGVTVVTCRDAAGRPAGLTVNSFTSVSLDPALVLWCLERTSPSLNAFTTSGHFAINVLDADQQPLSDLFADPEADRFAGLAVEDGLGGAPLLPGCLARFECALHALHDGGDHVILVGAVRRYAERPGNPLLYFSGEYRRVGG